MARVLIVDDDPDTSELLRELVRRVGHEAACAHTLARGMEEVLAAPYDVVFLDVRLPDGNGLDLLPRIRETPSSPEVIIITGYGDADGAELAVKSGAWDYVQKPFMAQTILLPLKRVFQYRENLRECRKQAVTLKFDGLVGTSAPMRACLDQVAQAANSDAHVLITGETGTGKELFSRAIHDNSSRRTRSLVVVDCAALPETLVESFLFGHEKGAFTGADRAKEGLVKQANQGTLFLDEVGELPLSVQKAFLRVLQERRFRAVGGKEEIRSDFRLIAATNRNLDQMVDEGLFRKDLLFRIRSISIELPPLRNRPEDIRELAFHYLSKLCKNYNIDGKGFSPDFLEAITQYHWPGNVRELINALESAISAARYEPILFLKHLPTQIRVQVMRSAMAKGEASGGRESRESGIHPKDFPSYRDLRTSVLEEAEKKYFEDLLEYAHGNLKEACRVSRLGRTQLYMLLKKHGLSRSDR